MWYIALLVLLLFSPYMCELVDDEINDFFDDYMDILLLDVPW